MPWKWIVCGCAEPLANVIRSRSPSRQRSVGPGDAPVVGPGGELHARRDLDLLVDRDQLPLAQRRGRSAAGASCPSRSRAGSRAGRSRWRRGRRSGRRGSSRGRRAPAAPVCASCPAAAFASPSHGCVCGTRGVQRGAPSPSDRYEPRSRRRRLSRGTSMIMACLNPGCDTGRCGWSASPSSPCRSAPSLFPALALAVTRYGDRGVNRLERRGGRATGSTGSAATTA